MDRRHLHLHLFRRCIGIYIEPRDAWIGVYLAEYQVYVCPVPFLVIRIDRRAW